MHIHERLHTDGTFPNKSRGGRRAAGSSGTGRRGKPKHSVPASTSDKKLAVSNTKAAVSKKRAVRKGKVKVVGGKLKISPTGDASVARSYIVRNRRTSSDEDDDEFTFHVHADGPTAVTTHYPAPPRRLISVGHQGVHVSVAFCSNF